MADDESRIEIPSPETADSLPTLELPTVRSEDILRGGRELLIRHASEIYRLRITRNGKLILTK